MMNSKKKALTVLSLAFALSLATTGAVYSATASADNEPFAIDAGASIKIVGTTDESAVDTESGIRFSATVTPEFVSTLGDNDYVGMMIVPSKVITAYANQEGEVEEDYLQFIADKKGETKTQIENDVACKYNKADLSTAENTTVYGVIASVKDDHYDDDYQAVAYYVKDGVYNYIGASEASTVTQVASVALLDTEFPYANEEKNALGNILEKSVIVRNGLTLNDGVYEMTLTETDTVDLQSEFGFAGDSFADIGLVVEKGNTSYLNNFITYDETANTLKSSMTGEWLDVTVTAYDGNVSLPLSISYEPTVKDVTWGDYELSTYGASTIDENGGVSMVAGSYTGDSYTSMGEANVPYVAFKGDFTSEQSVVVDFTGGNMPNIALFADQPDADTKNFVGASAIMFSQGVLNPNGENQMPASYRSRINVYGPRIFTKWNSTTFEDDTTSVANGNTTLIYTDASISTGTMISYADMEANTDTSYRLMVKFYVRNAKGQVAMTATLMQKNADYDGAEGTYPYTVVHIAKKNLSRTFDNLGLSSGSVILYGRPYKETKLDKIHAIYNNADDEAKVLEWTGETVKLTA